MSSFLLCIILLFFRSNISGLMDVRIFHRDRQFVPSKCRANNGGCSHLCLLAPAPHSYSCACPIGIKLLVCLLLKL